MQKPSSPFEKLESLIKQSAAKKQQPSEQLELVFQTLPKISKTNNQAVREAECNLEFTYPELTFSVLDAFMGMDDREKKKLDPEFRAYLEGESKSIDLHQTKLEQEIQMVSQQPQPAPETEIMWVEPQFDENQYELMGAFNRFVRNSAQLEHLDKLILKTKHFRTK